MSFLNTLENLLLHHLRHVINQLSYLPSQTTADKWHSVQGNLQNEFSPWPLLILFTFQVFGRDFDTPELTFFSYFSWELSHPSYRDLLLSLEATFVFLISLITNASTTSCPVRLEIEFPKRTITPFSWTGLPDLFPSNRLQHGHIEEQDFN